MNFDYLMWKKIYILSFFNFSFYVMPGFFSSKLQYFYINHKVMLYKYQITLLNHITHFFKSILETYPDVCHLE